MHAPPRPQRGAALLTAMIVVTLIATLAASMLWRQWRSVEIEAAERSRAQSSWILSGALDWARLILREDRRAQGPDHLGEPWATPLAEARLSTFLAADKNNTDDGPEAFLSGRIVDAQSRFNLTNLTQPGQAALPARKALQRLCENVNLEPSVAQRLETVLARAEQAASASAPVATPATDLPLMPPNTDHLRWLGLDDKASAALAPYVTVLPRATLVNINTASREVLSAVLQVDLGTADRIVQARQRTPFNAVGDLAALVPASALQNNGLLAVESDFFEVFGRLRLEHRVVEERSLVERRGMQIVTLLRERANLALPTTGATP